ncbi:ribosomal protein L21 [Salpingoeca rosetta]|uniref:Ribosomal protein L21 n=1 Tax=Salpingoeca rosetta (strain ATCC 50818 / BSB-021) TaxID=946362 RepID=F2TVA0_SALR5|nr:ribosomal protein L21 [Salpingoeca rosetta]EGD71996.1 ribosomal protein L21 [Salpingoeca rosetta]|eukprot:XP_004998568.1 ribosomal protein L21 [Salpingoeca rosetta]
MTNTTGLRRGTRYMFARPFRGHGAVGLKTYGAVYKVGQYVDIKGNGAYSVGLPHKSYHGKTGRVYNVGKRALGIVVNKRIKNRYVQKKINVRIEHVKHSKCRDDFLRRRASNDKLRAEARAAGKRISLKRKPAGPRPAHFVKDTGAQELRPLKYEFLA